MSVVGIDFGSLHSKVWEIYSLNNPLCSTPSFRSVSQDTEVSISSQTKSPIVPHRAYSPVSHRDLVLISDLQVPCVFWSQTAFTRRVGKDPGDLKFSQYRWLTEAPYRPDSEGC